MIGKVSIGKTFRGCVSYVMGKRGAEVIAAHGVRVQSPFHATQDFNAIRNQNSELSNAVWHTSISFAYQDKVTDKLMKKVAADYLEQMKLSDNQYLIVKHTDTRHQHMHIISNRVGFDGKVVSDQWCKNRTAHACDLMEEKYKLTVAREQGCARAVVQDKRKGVRDTKEDIKEAIEDSLKKGISNYGALKRDLAKKKVHLQLQKQSTGRIKGVTFRKDNIIIKGSALDKDFSYKKLLKALEAKSA